MGLEFESQLVYKRSFNSTIMQQQFCFWTIIAIFVIKVLLRIIDIIRDDVIQDYHAQQSTTISRTIGLVIAVAIWIFLHWGAGFFTLA